METAPSVASAHTPEKLREGLTAIVGAEFVKPASPGDQIAGVQPAYVVFPATEQEIAAILRFANDAGLAVSPRGGGTKLDWGNPPKRCDLILSTNRLSKILDYAWADLTVTVEAGCTFGNLQATVGEIGQRLAVDPLWPEQATIGGILSTNDTGALRLRFGGLRDLIIGATIALPDGTLASSGGKVVKNVAGYDLPKLTTGALGTLGIITRAVFRLHPTCPHTLTLSFSAPTLDDMQRHLLAIQDSNLAHISLQLFCAKDSSPIANILFEATEAGLAAQKQQLEQIVSPVQEASNEVWSARQGLVSERNDNTAILKFSILPTDIARAISLIRQSAAANANWSVVVQATGLGWMRLEGSAQILSKCVSELRTAFESFGGSLFLAYRAKGMESLDAWGAVGDAQPVMLALKQSLDPRGTLNPGRFVGGI